MVACDCAPGAPIGPTLASTCGGGQFMLFMGLLEVFLRSQCDLEDPCGRPKVTYYTDFFFLVVVLWLAVPIMAWLCQLLLIKKV